MLGMMAKPENIEEAVAASERSAVRLRRSGGPGRAAGAPGRARWPVMAGMRASAAPATSRPSAATATSMFSGFAIIPNIAAHLQLNLGYPREKLGGLYMVGGAVSFVVLRVAGRWVDRFGAPRVATAGTTVFVAVMLGAFAFPPPWLPVLAIFPCFMIGNSLRNVSMSTLSSRVPSPQERARFMSTQSAVQHLASALGASLSTQLLTVEPGGRLGGIRTLAFLSIAVATALPFLLMAVSGALTRREASRGEPAHPVATGLR